MRKGHRQPSALCYQYTIMSPYATYINYRLAQSYNILLYRYNHELTILAIEQASAPGTVELYLPLSYGFRISIELFYTSLALHLILCHRAPNMHIYTCKQIRRNGTPLIESSAKFSRLLVASRDPESAEHKKSR